MHPKESMQRRAKTIDHQPIRKRTEPAFIEAMQCKPAPALPSGEKWTFEIKFDGDRCIAAKRGREVTLFSRHRKVLNRRFPGVVQAIASLKDDFVLDGELVALDSQGRTSFQLMQNSLSQSLPIYCYADLLHRNGELLAGSSATCGGRKEATSLSKSKHSKSSSLVGLNSSPERYRWCRAHKTCASCHQDRKPSQPSSKGARIDH